MLTYDDVTGQFLGEFAPTAEGGLDYPNDIVVDSNGDILVASVFTRSVIKFSGRTGQPFFEYSGGGLGAPAGVLIGDPSTLLVASYSTDSVFKLNLQTGQPVGHFVAPGSAGLDGPDGLLWTAGGNLLVVSQRTDQILEFDGQDGSFVRVAAEGCGLDFPADLVFDGNGDLLVSSFGSDSVIKFSPDGECLGDFISTGSGGIDGAQGMAWGPNGNLFVASRYTHEVLEYDRADGSFVGVFVTAADGGLQGPTHLNFTELPDSDLVLVPSEYATIQTAIDAVRDGDQVLVADGVYTGNGNKDLDFRGKSVKVRSENGPENCIIDCQNSGRGFHFHSGETAEAVADGFTVRNGFESHGAGILCDSSSPTLVNLTISGNRTADGSGGAPGGDGGGIDCSFSSAPTIVNCTISGNVTGNGTDGGNGGGISIRGSSSPTVMNCTIEGNTTGTGSNGVRGGGRGGDGGGVFYDSSSAATITNCTIVDNTTGDGPGGRGLGGGVFVSDGILTLDNCILWNDSPEAIVVAFGDLVVTYSDVEGGFAGEGNIDAEPLFTTGHRLLPGSPCIDAADNTAVPADVADIDGDGDTGERLPLDLDGHARFADDPATADTGNAGAPGPEADAVVDMGSYEYLAGDGDGDGDADLVDFEMFAECVTGPGGGVPTECIFFDMDADVDVDLLDWRLFQAAFTGSP